MADDTPAPLDEGTDDEDMLDAVPEEAIDGYVTEEELKRGLGYGHGLPEAEEKGDVVSFFKQVLRSKDNTKTGFLAGTELGSLNLPVRSNLSLASYCNSMGMSGFAQMFSSEADIMNATSLSRDGFLDKLVVTSKKETSSRLGKARATEQKGGWFGKKKT